MGKKIKKKVKNQKHQQSQATLAPKRKKLFYAVLLSLPVLFIVILEFALRIGSYGGDTRLFVTAPAEVDKYYMCNRDVGKRYFFMQLGTPKPTKDLFLKKKPANGYRIFVLGGSTAAGFPYGNNLLFSRILNFKLQDVFPDKNIEVVNTAMSAINSYTLLDYLDEIFAQKPDALLIYAGHNEFYGAMGVGSMESLGRIPAFTRFYLKLQKFKVFLLVRNFIGTMRRTFSKSSGNPRKDLMETLMEKIVGEQTIPYNSKLYKRGIEQWRTNLNLIFKKAKKAGVPVVISELVSNVRDQAPFVSVPFDTLPTANKAFQLARKLDEQHKYDEAKEAYYWAKKLDALRFRATEDFNDIIHATAQEYDSPVVPMKAYFDQDSPQGIVGNNLMVDHLHPNIEGCFLMAEAFFQTLKQHRFISDSWDSTRIKPIEYYEQHWGITRLDTACAKLNVMYLKGGWPFQPKGTVNQTLSHVKLNTKVDSLAFHILTNDQFSIETGHYQLAQYYEKTGAVEDAYNEYNALYHSIPWEMLFLDGAARTLIRLKRGNEALPLLYKSLEVRESLFANKWLGKILVDQERYSEAIPYLEKADGGRGKDVQVLLSLRTAYKNSGHEELAAQVEKRLKAAFTNRIMRSLNLTRKPKDESGKEQ
jgi:lysophospholipase L1-like esterase